MKILFPLLVLAAGLVAAWALISHSPQAKLQAPPRELPEVRVIRVEPRTVRLNVDSQGIVAPRAETDLVSEVAGRVVKVAPSFAAGGFFKWGEVLVAIDPRDYEFAVTKAQAQVVEARRALLQEQAEVEQARSDWKALGEGKPTDFALRKPHLAEAQAKLAAAEAELKLARLNLERTELRAPFDGRVREKKVDVGQYVTQGSALARLYAADIAEVRLPLAIDQLAYLDLPLSYRDVELRRASARVRLTARLASW
ncbi:MAG: efflux RND transporter periplasmic adaptor subunit [Chloroflexi bacterium]|nr:efflux RND transporter periplasmic adaptor subunit [Chloroflexota bacterium]